MDAAGVWWGGWWWEGGGGPGQVDEDEVAQQGPSGILTTVQEHLGARGSGRVEVGVWRTHVCLSLQQTWHSPACISKLAILSSFTGGRKGDVV